MNMKDAFRYQNKLQKLMEEGLTILSRPENVLKVENTVLRKKVMPDEENERTIEAAPSEFADQITLVVLFVSELLRQRELLSQAICQTKKALPIDLDGEVGLNAKRQEMARVLKYMTSLRNSEVLIPGGGKGYRFNQEGNQVSYCCDVKRTTTINFDRKRVRNLAAELNRKSDEISSEVDRCLINASVDYTPPFDVNDSFAEIFCAFKENQSMA